MKKGILILFFIAKLTPSLWAQQDTTTVLNYDTYYEIIISNHPILRQANTLPETAKAELMMAKGAFDTKIQSNFDQKYFDKKYYYNFWDTQLKVPIANTGVDAKIGYERNTGLVLGSDILTPRDGLSYFGIETPILQRLLIDQRRADLKNAQLFVQMSDFERVKSINKFILSGAKAYWDWYFTHQQLKIAQDFYALSLQRFGLVRTRVLQGDLPGLDTLDAKVTLLDRKVALEQAQTEFQNAKLLVSNYIWDDKGNPTALAANIIPQTVPTKIINQEDLNRLIDIATERHPELQKLTIKNQQLRIDERLARNMLLPRLDIGLTSLNLTHRLITGYRDDPASTKVMPILSNFYKFNVDFSMPLQFRKERGKLNLVRIKQLQNNLEFGQLKREINNDILVAYNDLKNLEKQLTDQQQTIQAQQQLLQIEERRFSMGESQFFLINQRETKLSELQIKWQLMKAKYEKAKATLLFAAGLSEW